MGEGTGYVDGGRRSRFRFFLERSFQSAVVLGDHSQ